VAAIKSLRAPATRGEPPRTSLAAAATPSTRAATGRVRHDTQRVALDAPRERTSTSPKLRVCSKVRAAIAREVAAMSSTVAATRRQRPRMPRERAHSRPLALRTPLEWLGGPAQRRDTPPFAGNDHT